MTLQIEPPPAPAGAGLERRYTPLPAPRRRPADIVPTRTPATPRVEPLDAIAKRFYASAVVGAGIAAAAALTMHLLGWPTSTLLGHYLFGLIVLGASMFVGGGITGSARTRAQIGGAR